MNLRRIADAYLRLAERAGAKRKDKVAIDESVAHAKADANCSGSSKHPESPDDYRLYVTTKFVSANNFFGVLALVRTTDGP